MSPEDRVGKTDDLSYGWEDVAREFSAHRSSIGLSTVLQWAATLPVGASVLDIGCGSGAPISVALAAEGFRVAGVDASPTLLAGFRQRLPDADAACEPAETSEFFGRTFDAAIAIGLVFLLPEAKQRILLRRAARALKPGGALLFSAPKQVCEWQDLLTGFRSASLGAEEYERILRAGGMKLVGSYTDEGENHYFEAHRSGG